MQSTTLKGYRLSQQQAHCWHWQRAGQVQGAVRLHGSLQIAGLRQALDRVMQQQTILRTTYRRLAGMEVPVQVVFPVDAIAELLDFREEESVGGRGEKEVLDDLFAREDLVQVDLAVGPLVRVRVIRLPEDHCLLFVSLPALSADEATLKHLLAALSRAYAQAIGSEGEEEEEEEPLHYANVAAWQYELLEEEEAEEGRAYWQQIPLAEASHMQVPLSRRRGAEHESEHAAVPWPEQETKVPCSLEQSRAIVALSERLNVSVEAIVLASWQILVWRLGEQELVVMGVARDGRHYEELAHALGLYTRFVPLQKRLFANQSFERIVQQTDAALKEASKWQSYFTWDEESEQQGQSFFPLGFVWEEWPDEWQAGELRWHLVRRETLQEPGVLTLQGMQQGTHIHLRLKSAPTHLSHQASAHLASCLQTVLWATVQAPQTILVALPLLSPSHRDDVLRLGQGTGMAPLTVGSIAEAFEQQVARTPHLPALVCTEQHLSYHELNARANQMAHWLRAQGVQPGHLVGLCCGRSVGALVGLLAILKAGGGYVPLDPEQPKTRLSACLTALTSDLLLSEHAVQECLPSWSGRVLILETVAQEIATFPSSNLPPADRVQHPAYVIFTSGSTGTPKGVLITQGNLLSYIQSLQAELSAHVGWHYGLVTTLAADLGKTMLYGALLSGGCLHVLSYEQITDAQLMHQYLHQHPLDVLKMVPTHLHALLAASLEPIALLPRRALVLGGEAFSLRLLKRLREVGAMCQVYNHYGPTETTIGAMIHPLGVLRAGEILPGEDTWETVPIGHPLPHARVLVVDRRGELVPWGAQGEVWIGGAGVGQGYVGRAESTAERYVPHAQGAEGERWYRSGDEARWTPEGLLEYQGRQDGQVKVRGVRVELGEIAAVLEALETVREAVVVLRTEEAGSEGRLVAYVVGKQQPWPTSQQLREALAQRLPEALVPVAYVMLRVLPLTRNGKLDRSALPAPQEEEVHHEAEEQEWQSPIEELIAEIWREVLGTRQRVLGRHELFASLGGHSLLATQVIARLRSVFSVEIPIRALFEAPTIAGLGQRVEEARREHQGLPALPLLVPVSRQQALPLSFAQQRLWFLDQLEPESSSYTKIVAVQLTGPLTVQALEQSLTEIVRRHESVRTVFGLLDGHPVQQITAPLAWSLPLIDLRTVSQADRDVLIRDTLQREAIRPFDLAHGPMLRTCLVRLEEHVHLFVLSMHHIVSDAWSNEVLTRELSLLYRAFAAGQPSPLPDLPIQYADYAFWQRNWLQGAVLEQQVHYWREHLADVAVLDLPTDHPRPPIQRFRGDRRSLSLSTELTTGLRELAREEGVTLFMLLLAAFETLLARYSGQETFAVGTPVANRTHLETEGLIGFFVNTLVLRADLTGNPTFQHLLRRVRECALGAYGHQDVPFEHLVEVLQPERDLSRSPLFQVMFQMQNRVRGTQMTELLPGLTLRPLGVEGSTAKFDLTMTVLERVQEVQCLVEYNTDLFEAGTIERVLGHWQTLLQGIVAQPQQSVALLPLLCVEEREQQIVHWNATQIEVPALGVHQLFEQQVQRRPEAIALVFEETHLTYHELDRHATRIAQLLRASGVGLERAVGLFMERSPELVIAILGVLKAGGAYVPLDPDYPAERLAFMIEDSQVALVVTQWHLRDGLPTCPVPLWGLEEALWEERALSDEQAPLPMVDPEHLVHIIYTSGSTGLPKGVMNSHRGLCNRLVWAQHTFPLQQTDRVLQKTPFSFDVSVWEFLWPLCAGACLTLARPTGHRDPTYLINTIVEQAISVIHFVPSMLNIFLEEPTVKRCQGTLRQVYCSGEALAWEVQRRFFASLDADLLNLYGPTEASIEVTYWKCVREEAHHRVPIGRPIANTQMYVLDARLEPVPIGVTGDLYIGGTGLARGYLHQPALTAERFVAHPFASRMGERLYRTGDRGRYRSDGAIEFLGRQDGQIKLRGLRIELGEIETALQQQPAVENAVVLLREDEPGDQRLVAYVVGEEQGEEANQEIRSQLGRTLPQYMVPSQIIWLAAIPLTPSGKVDRRALPVPAVASEETVILQREHPLEELLGQIFEQVLHRAPIGREENFFALGGHSLLATQVMARLRTSLQVEMPLRSLFESPTIAGLRQRVEEALREQQGAPARPALMPVSRQQALPLSFAQQRLWFLDQLEPENLSYSMPYAIQLHGSLRTDALEGSVRELMSRHESLRTVFRVQDEEPQQCILPVGPFPLPVVDLTSLPEGLREKHARRLARQEATRPFALAQGPVLRACVLRLGEQEHLFLLTMHHIVSDAWSLEIFVRELSLLYRAFAAGQPSPLPDLPIQYADYALWQRTWLQGDVLEQQVRYWQHQLAEVPVLELPTDYPRSPVQRSQGDRVSLSLSEQLTTGLRDLARAEGVTLFMLLLAAFEALLARYSGQDIFAVGTPVANRTHLETEGLIGFFVNTLVLRADLTGQPTFRQLVQRVRECALGAYGHQDVPFEHLVEVLQPERDLSRSPLFQVLFQVQNAAGREQSTELLPGLTLHPMGMENTTAKFDLNVTLFERARDFQCVLEYRTDLFAPSTVHRLLHHFQTFLGSIIEAPEGRVSTLPLLTPEQRLHQLSHWNQTQHRWPSPVHISLLLAEQAERTPQRIAVCDAHTQLTYGALQQRVLTLACQLQQLGIGQETLVGLYMDRSPAFLISLLALWQCAAAVLPLDPASPAARLQRVLEQAQVPFLLTTTALREQIPGGIRIVCLEPLEQFTMPPPYELALLPALFPPSLAYVIYTSGSTGLPKGVMVTHEGMLNHLWAKVDALHLSETDVVAQTASQSFDISIWQLLAGLVGGGQVQIVPDALTHDPHAFVPMIAQRAVSILQVVPSLLGPLLDEVASFPSALENVRWLIVTGEAMPVDLCRRWWNTHGAIGLMNAYGPTECSDDVTHALLAPHEEGKGEWRVPIGRPLANTQLYILDASGEPVPLGVVGEIYVGGRGVGRGYLQEPVRTADVFVPDPYSGGAGSRLYRTGDRGRYRPDGVIEFLGRHDAQIKLRGYRIELGEIEAALRHQAGIREAVVVLREDEPGDQRLVAYVVGEESVKGASQDIRSQLGRMLPEYMVPGQMVWLETLPLTPNGKVDRRALPVPAGESVTSEEAMTRQTEHPLEELLRQIFEQVLHRAPIGREENFFALGGHSLLATQVMARLRTRLQIEVPLRRLFESPTIAGLRQRVEEALREQQGIPARPALVPVSRQQALPLSFAQQRLWFLDQLEPENLSYSMPYAIQLRGSLRTDALEGSVRELTSRHESLRTVFRVQDEEPQQCILPVGPFPLPVVDLTSLPEGLREKHARRLARQEATRPFALAQGPVLRACVLRLGEQEHLFLLTMHHIVSDAWSLEIFVRELSLLYRAFAAGQPSPLPALPIQYADYALWQRTWLQGEVLEQQVRYWQHQLAGVPVLELPTDHPRPPVQRAHGNHRSLVLSTDLTTGLRELAREEGVTLFMLLLAAFETLLARYSGQDTFAVGTPIANRTQQESEGLIGFFVNTLVLRADLTGQPTFQNLLQRVRECALGAYGHQDVPFEHLVEVLQPERDLSRSPLFQVLFQMQNAARGEHPRELLPGLTLHPLALEQTSAKFDLTLMVVERVQQMQCVLEYNTDLFEAGTIERFLGHWQTLLEGIVAHPHQSIATLPLLTEQQREQHLVTWNATTVDGAPLTLQQRFEAQVQRSPEAIALVFEEGHLTYQELDRRATHLASQLQRAGIGPERLVGLSLERSLEMVIALLSVLKTGGAYLPLDPASPVERLKWILTDAAPHVLLTQSALLARCPADGLRCICVDQYQSNEGDADVSLPSHQVAATNMAYVIYTSGSTGHPKGVVISYGALDNFLSAMQHAFPLSRSDRLLQKTSSVFDASVWEFYAPLLVGGTLVLARPGEHQESRSLADAIGEQQITAIQFVPSMLRLFLQEDLRAATALNQVFCAGEALTADLHQRFFECLPTCSLQNFYGPTEATINATFWKCEAREDPLKVPIGRPLANMQVYVLDAHLEPVPVGVPGDLYIGGAGLARGYLHQPALTAERFVAHPFAAKPGERLYHTGDRGCSRSDGVIEFLGRQDGQIKLRGLRIELGEIESVLLQHPGIRECVVLMQEEIIVGPRLIAYVVVYEKEKVTISVLQNYLKERLPGYMLPSFIKLLEKLPLMPNGKLHRQELLLMPLQKDQLETIVKPRNDLEIQLVQIWEEVLNIRPIGILDNFFDLGGHSILAVRLTSRIQKQFRHDLALSTLFRYPTIAELAYVINQQIRSENAPIVVPIQTGGSKLPIFCVHPAGGAVFCYTDLARYLGPEQPFYGLQAALLAGEKTSYEKLEKLSRRYIVALKEVQPQGPYLLGGWSLGGVIAFEMAQQLQRQGDSIALLALFDTNLPVAYLYPEKIIELAHADDAMLAMDIMSSINIVTPGEDFYQFEPEEQLNYAVELAKQVNSLPADADIEQVRHLGNIVKTNAFLVNSYHPQLYPYPITLFRANPLMTAAENQGAHTEVSTLHNPTLGWDQLTNAGVDVHIVPGKHSAMMDEPHVQALAIALQDCLDKVHKQ